MIRKLKYAGQPASATHLAYLLAGRVSGMLAGEDAPEAVIALPSHWLRRLTRGIDHAGLLATALARRLNLPEAGGLVRGRNTPPQARLSRSARMDNVRGAFEITSNRELAGAHLLLVDDVTTTGATAAEAARTLRAAGARRVTLAVAGKSERVFSYRAHLRGDRDHPPADQPPSSSSASSSS
jgi:ComF family protein